MIQLFLSKTAKTLLTQLELENILLASWFKSWNSLKIHWRQRPVIDFSFYSSINLLLLLFLKRNRCCKNSFWNFFKPMFILCRWYFFRSSGTNIVARAWRKPVGSYGFSTWNFHTSSATVKFSIKFINCRKCCWSRCCRSCNPSFFSCDFLWYYRCWFDCQAWGFFCRCCRFFRIANVGTLTCCVPWVGYGYLAWHIKAGCPTINYWSFWHWRCCRRPFFSGWWFYRGCLGWGLDCGWLFISKSNFQVC